MIWYVLLAILILIVSVIIFKKEDEKEKKMELLTDSLIGSYSWSIDQPGSGEVGSTDLAHVIAFNNTHILRTLDSDGKEHKTNNIKISKSGNVITIMLPDGAISLFRTPTRRQGGVIFDGFEYKAEIYYNNRDQRIYTLTKINDNPMYFSTKNN